MSDAGATSGPEPPVIARIEGAWGRLTLNRPRTLHALTTEMCERMIDALVAWRGDPAVAAVLIDHAGERGFCSGGDVRMAAESGMKDGVEGRRFFFTEYRLNALLYAYEKPVVAIMDGVTMGGGVGISAPATYRVSTERTVFAMPETTIGLFPDVGGGWMLPRLPGETGTWLALTGARLNAADCLLLGIATDHVESGRVEALKAELVARPDAIDTVLTEFEADPGEPPLAAHQDEIDRCFAWASAEAILEALDEGSDWARRQAEILRDRSPQSMKVALRLLREGRSVPSFEAEMAKEYAVAARVVSTHDFIEGVRAVLVDKDHAPRWRPARLDQVSDAMLDAIFAPLPPEEAWTPLT